MHGVNVCAAGGVVALGHLDVVDAHANGPPQLTADFCVVVCARFRVPDPPGSILRLGRFPTVLFCPGSALRGVSGALCGGGLGLFRGQFGIFGVLFGLRSGEGVILGALFSGLSLAACGLRGILSPQRDGFRLLGVGLAELGCRLCLLGGLFGGLSSLRICRCLAAQRFYLIPDVFGPILSGFCLGRAQSGGIPGFFRLPGLLDRCLRRISRIGL